MHRHRQIRKQTGGKDTQGERETLGEHGVGALMRISLVINRKKNDDY